MHDDHRVLLADFGLANFADTTTGSSPIRHVKAYWTAPEIIDPARFNMKSGRPSRQSDIFDFAGLAWEVRIQMSVSITISNIACRFTTATFPSSTGPRHKH